MTAAIVDPRARSYDRLLAAFKDAGRRQPEGIVHANKMRAHEREPLEQLLVENDAVHFLTAVRAPIVDKHAKSSRGAEDQARQRCVGELAVRMWARLRVSHMVLESRNPDPKEDPAAYRRSIKQYGNRDHADISTIATLKGLTELGPKFQVEHNPKSEAQLWLADVATYAAQQSIARNDPGRLATLAPKMELREAVRLPIEERPQLSAKEARKSGLDLRLDELVALARQVSAKTDRQAAYAESDDEGVQSAAARLAAARLLLEKNVRDLEKREQQRQLPVPPLPEILDPSRRYDRDR